MSLLVLLFEGSGGGLFNLFYFLLGCCFAPVALCVLSSGAGCVPASLSGSPQMKTLVKSPFTSPVKCFQLRDKSGLFHFHLVPVNVIFL